MSMDSQAKSWHAMDAHSVLSALDATPKGLSTEQVNERLKQYSKNRLPEAKRAGPLLRFLLQFHNVLIYILLAAGVLKTALAQWVDAGVIFGVVVINALIGFIQEGRAEKALDAIRRMMSLHARVRRDGGRHEIDTEELVPGDIVLLGSGDKVPADLRLLEARELQIDEAMLTGESLPVEKDIRAVPENAELGDRQAMAFSGTLVTSGRGVGVVVETAARTELGKISTMVSETTAISTPLIQKVNHFAHWLAVIIGIFAAFTFLIGMIYRQQDLIELLFAAIALAVAAIPEGLPAIMTIILAIGVRRMAQRNAIIRRLPAVDTLGALTVICSDKTGTLTRNEMTVVAVGLADRDLTTTGTGYEPKGSLEDQGKAIDANQLPHLLSLAAAAVLCNESELEQESGQWRTQGDPMEGALLTLAAKAGFDNTAFRHNWPTLDTIPFESEHRFMATLHEIPADFSLPGVQQPRIAWIKGAPEKLVDACTRQLGVDGPQDIEPKLWHEREQRMAAAGQRVLALACKPLSGDCQRLDFDDVQTDLILLGLVGIVDPPREEAIAAVKNCQQAGIRVVMITGDHALTAQAIGEQLHIGDGKTAISGQDLSELDEGGLKDVASRCDVFARVSPQHKLQLVDAIQSQGQVVAMTGDGVNDAPALKRADVGIAMGLKGTEVTKEAAEMVLADDNFASIERAVAEGRTVFDNLRKSLLFILPTNGGEGATIFLAILLGRTLPLTPVQVLWVNMVTAVTLALALAFEPPEFKVMRRPPRDPRAGLLNRYFVWRIFFVAAIMCAGTFGMFVWGRAQGFSEEYSRTLAVNTIVLFEAFYLFNCRYLTAPVLNRHGLFGSSAVWICVGLVILLQLLFTYVPVVYSLLGAAPLAANHWFLIILVSSSVLWLVELEKWLTERFRTPHPDAIHSQRG
ncbi:MAG TPA: cation-transporting P-type ATPase [Pirellulaceae bacterium]|nr:cation-transporting P-type ATPase [Pirellulaceae bacterium]HMO91326.1 cation-transporting P-type ATPase [Pirellulaceae bacterium]HMP70145.1 cation-transporting P-type ATPase [Pirellulaceae bacterium]